MIRSALKTAAFAVPATITFLDTCGYVCRVEGDSMKPVVNATKQTKNYIFLSRWGYRNFNFTKGQVVCLSCPTDPRQKILKRIIALEGDTVKTLNYKEEFVKIPKGYCWVEGDNHRQSLDSNIFGPVPLGLIHSKATHVVWPVEDFRPIPIVHDPTRVHKHEVPDTGQLAAFDLLPPPAVGLREGIFISSVKSKSKKL